jgi:hypothetical protein
MTNVLVPLDSRRGRQLTAAYFALEFAKRTGAKVLFLRILPGALEDPSQVDPAGAGEEIEDDLGRLINDSLMSGLRIETHVTHGDFVERVAEFAQHHNVSRVVLAVQDDSGPGWREEMSRMDNLRERLGCALVTVRQRQEAAGASIRAS